MSRVRILLLALAILLFLGIGVWYIYSGVRLARTTFPSGAPPQDIKNAIVPKQIELSRLRPPALRQTDPVRYGNATSAASVIEFGDFECEACKQVKQTIERVIPSYHGRVRFVWRDLPVTDVNPRALDAAVFARCAHLQGKFWDVYDALFARDVLTESAFRDIAEQARIDLPSLAACRKDPTVRSTIQREVDVARGDGINTAPLIFVGTKAMRGVIAPDVLDREIKLFLAS